MKSFLKCQILLLLVTYSKQNCTFLNNVFSCQESNMENMVYEYNLKYHENTEISSIEIVNSDYTLTENFFDSMDNSGKEKVTEIKVSDCRLQQIKENAFEKYKSLNILDLSHNEIEEMIFIETLPNSIEVLYLRNNSFTSIPDVFSSLRNLHHIDLSFCKLKELDFTVFKQLPFLAMINVSNNNMETSVSKEYLKNIKCVDISHNRLIKIDNIPSFCLDFSYNNISGYHWYNVSEKNTTVFVEKFYYVGNSDLNINATNLHKHLLDIEIKYLNVSEYKSNISSLELTNVKITKEFILTRSFIPSLDKSIYNFKELFYMENPNTTFDLSNNSIVEINELYFEKYDLEILNLCYNNIKNLLNNVFLSAHFAELLLCYSDIENINEDAFSGSNIKKLNLSHNKLHDIIFLGSVNGIENLDLSYNFIKSIEVNAFSKLNDLEVINLSNNLINFFNVEVFKLPQLSVIDLRNNQLVLISSFSFSSLPNLSQLLLEGNSIKTIETNAFKSLPKLSVLNLINITLENLQSGAFSDLNQLEVLNLNGNNISILPINVFQGVPQLKYIYLCKNNINSLTALNNMNLNTLEITMSDDFPTGNFRLPYLTKLYITESNINVLNNSLFLGLYNLKELHLKNSIIASVEPNAFKGLFRLQYLDPQILNQIVVLKTYLFRDLISLVQLDLSGLKIAVLEPEAFYGLRKLKSLYLNNNSIVELNANVFIGLESVKELHLSGNNITKLYVNTFTGLDGIRELLLNKNNISLIPLGSLQRLGSLEMLNLAQNSIIQIDVGTFSGLKNLKYLDISSNKIRSICKAAIYPLKNLETFYLAGNYLHNIEFITDVENFPRLQLVNFDQNSFSCVNLDLVIRTLEKINVSINSQFDLSFETVNIDGFACQNDCANNLSIS